MIWAVMPFIDLWDEYTRRAAEDVLGQEGCGDVRLLLISNGSKQEEREKAERWLNERRYAESLWPQVLLWHHNPPLPALGASWNQGILFALQSGADLVWVVNNDARFAPHTLGLLAYELKRRGALFVSAVGVREEQFTLEPPMLDLSERGGPDYSCFLLSRECFEKFPFDQNLTYTGDIDHHRAMMLAGEGDRIFSVNVPYLHYASRTINRSEEALAEHHRVNAQHHEYFARKWGGAVNQERWARAFDPESAKEGVTTPELFEQVRDGWKSKA